MTTEPAKGRTGCRCGPWRQLSVAADWAYVFDGAAGTRSGAIRFHAALTRRF